MNDSVRVKGTRNNVQLLLSLFAFTIIIDKYKKSNDLLKAPS